MADTTLLATAGTYLRYSQATTTRAMVYLNRLIRGRKNGGGTLGDEPFVFSATALFLAGKGSETPRRVRDVVNAVYFAYNPCQRGLSLDDAYFRCKMTIIDAEQQALRELTFNVEAETPLQLTISLAHALRCDAMTSQIALALANDALWSRSAWAHSPVAVAASVIEIAHEVCMERDDIETCQIIAENSPLWHGRVGALEAEVQAVHQAILGAFEKIFVKRNDVESKRRYFEKESQPRVI